MKTLTLKLPESIDARLNVIVQKKGLSRSEIVRHALVEYLSREHVDNSGTFLDLSKDLAGSIEGPPDLSTSQVHLEEYGK